VLVGRHEPDGKSRDVIDGLASKGVATRVVRGDVGDLQAMRALFADLPGGIAALRGVIHAAGVLDDGVLLQQEWNQFRRVLAPKVDGAWHLHRLSAKAPLDFFVLFSSVASILGGAGQGNHAAANAFEDALAFARRAKGLPGTSINWGSWASIGSAAREDFAKRRRQIGLEDLSAAEGLARLRDVLVARPTQIAVARIDWTRFASQWTGRAPSWLRGMAAGSAAPATVSEQPTSAPRSLTDMIAALPESNRRSAIERHVHELAVRILGFEPHRRIDARQPLNELGLDSLMAVEFRNALAGAMGCALPATLLFSYPAIDDVTQFLAGTILKLPDRTAATAAAVVPAAAIDAIADLSDEEVDRLLAEKTGGRL
jgi:acyl carrier protein